MVLASIAAEARRWGSNSHATAEPHYVEPADPTVSRPSHFRRNQGDENVFDAALAELRLQHQSSNLAQTSTRAGAREVVRHGGCDEVRRLCADVVLLVMPNTGVRSRKRMSRTRPRHRGPPY